MPKNPEDLKREMIRRVMSRRSSEPVDQEIFTPDPETEEEGPRAEVMNELASILNSPQGEEEEYTEEEQYEDLMNEEEFRMFDAAMQEAHEQGFEAYFQGAEFESNPYLTEDVDQGDDPVVEAWDNGWTSAYIEDHVTQIVLEARRFVKAEESIIAEASLNALEEKLNGLSELLDLDDLEQRWDHS